MNDLNAIPADTIVIRAAQPSDSEAVWPLLTQFVTSYTPDPACYHAQFDALLTASHAWFLVAEAENKVVGYVLAFHLPTLFANGSVCEIQELMVDPQYRSRGIGRTLVQTIIATAQQSGAREITVPTRRAGDYYLALGFEATATYYKLRLPSSQT